MMLEIHEESVYSVFMNEMTGFKEYGPQWENFLFFFVHIHMWDLQGFCITLKYKKISIGSLSLDWICHVPLDADSEFELKWRKKRILTVLLQIS